MQSKTPDSFDRANERLTVTKNQCEIFELAKSSNLIFLEPILPRLGGGNVEHYYHFLFDLVLPLYFVIKATSPNLIFVIKSIGIYTDRLKDLFPGRIIIDAKGDYPKKITKRINLIGMNPRCVYLSTGDIQQFRKDIVKTLKIDKSGERNKVLLIERLPPDPYFTTVSRKKGGGSERRSIINHVELSSTLKSMLKAPFEFHNIQLEKVSFKEQIDYFDKALLVIGQHGAGLANIIWMMPKSIVIELNSNQSLDHFRIISKLSHHSHYCYKTLDSHADVDMASFVSWILNITDLGRFFSHPGDHDIGNLYPNCPSSNS